MASAQPESTESGCHQPTAVAILHEVRCLRNSISSLGPQTSVLRAKMHKHPIHNRPEESCVSIDNSAICSAPRSFFPTHSNAFAHAHPRCAKKKKHRKTECRAGCKPHRPSREQAVVGIFRKGENRDRYTFKKAHTKEDPHAELNYICGQTFVVWIASPSTFSSSADARARRSAGWVHTKNNP